MEHDIIKEWFHEHNIEDKGRVALLSEYASMIYSVNSQFNITGLRTIGEIVKVLILNSIAPLKNINVPRGTSCIDLGTGSGVPGIPLAVFFPYISFVLIDANKKKTDFIQSFKLKYNLENVTVLNGRVEALGHNISLRESFDFCVSRAFGPIYYSLEFGVPFINSKGFFYIYSHLNTFELSSGILQHADILGANFVDESKHVDYGISKKGLLLNKKSVCPQQYPRRFPVVKRKAVFVPETK